MSDIDQASRIKGIRKTARLTQRALSELLKIPLRTIENWEAGKRNPPEYVIDLIEYRLNTPPE